jgi:hypothetical protein
MLRAIETFHADCFDERLRRLKIASADRSTPYRTHVVAVWLQDILLQLVIRINSTADITHRDCKDTLPGCALRARAAPCIADGIRSTRGSCVGIIVVASNLPSI